ncbi:hypothetical protein ABIB25_004072 [Nakamurella sp. UYEF19]|uniref:hypothetical protein n=1 Tax=Nakamurella sp. UYEF19 TaxID=1756392 RepID=UPI003390E02B
MAVRREWAVRQEWDGEPWFGDALSGSGGLAEPVQPVFASALTADVFPDALSSTFAGAVSATPVRAVPAVVGSPAALPPPVAARVVPVVRRAPARPAPRSAPRSVPSGAPPRGMPSGFPPPGSPPPQGYVPPLSSQQPPPGYPAAGWAPLPGLAGGPTYRPVGPQRQVVVPQRQVSGPQRQAGGSRPPVPPLTVSRTPRKKSSSAWGFLFVLLIVLVTSGVGQKIINAISELLQRK